MHARDWLDRRLFIAAPCPGPARRSRLLAGIVIAVVLTAAQLLRMSSSRPLDSLWAEDGGQWLTDALGHSFSSNLRAPYDGYLETSSRLIAEPISRLPVSWYAVAMAIAGALVVTGCAFVVWTASAGHIRFLPLRLAMAGLVVLAPTAGVEMLANVTNTIWYLLFTSFWLLLWRAPTLPRAAASAGLLALAALSTAGVVFMLPLWLLRAIAVRTARDLVVVTALPLGLAFQISPLAKGVRGQATARWSWDLLPAYAQRVVAGAGLGDRLAGALWEHLGTSVEIVAGLGLIALIGYAIRRARPVVVLAVGISLLSFLTTGYERAAGAALLWSPGSDSTVLTRYTVVPSLLLLAGVIVLADDLHGQRSRRARAVVLGWLVVVVATSFSIGNPALRGTPRYSTGLRAARATCRSGATVATVPISLFFRPMRVPCRRLR